MSAWDAAAGVCAVPLDLGEGLAVWLSLRPLGTHFLCPPKIEFRPSKRKFGKKLRGDEKNLVRQDINDTKLTDIKSVFWPN